MNWLRFGMASCALALLALGAAPALAGEPETGGPKKADGALIPDITEPEALGPDYLPSGGWRTTMPAGKGKKAIVWLAFGPRGTFVMNMRREGGPLATREGTYQLTGESLAFTVKGKPFMAGKIKMLSSNRWAFTNGKEERTFERITREQLTRELALAAKGYLEEKAIEARRRDEELFKRDLAEKAKKAAEEKKRAEAEAREAREAKEHAEVEALKQELLRRKQAEKEKKSAAEKPKPPTPPKPPAPPGK